MAAEDFFKRYVDVGASILGMSRERAEGTVRDFVASGEVAKEQANKAADWLVERGRTGTEELAELIRREIGQQLGAMGLATRADIARLEARLDATEAFAAGSLVETPRAEAAATPETVTDAATAARPGRAGAAGKKATRRERTAAPPSEGPGGAGITRSGSVRRGTGGAGPPPAGDAVPPKG